jgi:hypothetical protein
MAGADRMTIEEVVKQVLVDERGSGTRGAGGGLPRADGSRGVRPDRCRARRTDAGSGHASQRVSAAGVADAGGQRGSCRSSSCGAAATSRRFSSRAGVPSRHCSRSFRSATCAAPPLVASISWLSASGCASPSRRSAGSAARWTNTSTRSAPGRWRRLPVRLLRCQGRKVRDGGRVVTKALVIAHGVHETGRREIIGIDVGEAETEAFWTTFLRDLVARGLIGVPARRQR